MKQLLYIVFPALVLTGCASSRAPLDDAYYWPDGRQQEEYAVQPSPESSPDPAASAGSTAPSVEYISVQDTTVTVKIKR
ncbi:MAG: hypothetical protein IJP45_05795 [Paludibacteraceae bacterium]|nr:hypothetical protein [Paludibacteraceae bacterium]MBQ6747885.1 hypothetical protein [Paludibacteraceae bacterium]MBQ6764681.1 hypothetical protein [Paludibacteraceae bacterium]